MSIERYFEPGIVVERYIEGTDELGNPTKTWSHHLDIVGRIDTLGGMESLSGGKMSERSTHMLFCPVVDILCIDRVIFKGLTYNVTFVDDPMNYGRFLQVELELVR